MVTVSRWAKRSPSAERKAFWRSSSPENSALDSVTSTLPGSGGQVGHQRHDRDLRVKELPRHVGHGWRRRHLEDDAVAAAPADGGKHRDEIALADRLGHVEAGGEGSRPHARQFRLEGGTHGIGKARRRFHDDIDDEAASGEPGGRILAFQLGNRRLDLPPGDAAHARPVMQHAVDSGEAEARLERNVLQRVGRLHGMA
jgi:hypothetical protein